MCSNLWSACFGVVSNSRTERERDWPQDSARRWHATGAPMALRNVVGQLVFTCDRRVSTPGWRLKFERGDSLSARGGARTLGGLHHAVRTRRARPDHTGQLGARKIRIRQDCATEVRIGHVVVGQVVSGHGGAGQIDVVEINPRELRAPQVTASEAGKRGGRGTRRVRDAGGAPSEPDDAGDSCDNKRAARTDQGACSGTLGGRRCRGGGRLGGSGRRLRRSSCCAARRRGSTLRRGGGRLR